MVAMVLARFDLKCVCGDCFHLSVKTCRLACFAFGLIMFKVNNYKRMCDELEIFNFTTWKNK